MVPVDLPAQRRKEVDSTLDAREHTKFLGAAGQLMWVAQQVMPILCAPLSYLMSDAKTATVQSILEANKLIRLAKARKSEGLTFHQHRNPCIATWSDAAHASRKDLNSQGGYLVTVADGDFLNDAESSLTFLSWNSWKLTR
eukprot:9605957-Alexandrium_andersonii.AAC.1